MKISKEDMKQITGGVNWVGLTLITSGISFVLGMLEGIFNPQKCK